jgi:hypothetical protein
MPVNAHEIELVDPPNRRGTPGRVYEKILISYS